MVRIITALAILVMCTSPVMAAPSCADENGDPVECIPSSCPTCPLVESAVDELVNNNNSRLDSANGNSSPQTSYQEAVAECSKISQFPWEQETSTNGNQAFNCRDFSRWFRECMVRSGYPEVSIVGLYCTSCASKGGHGHAINVIKTPEGKFCPFEPQNLSTAQGDLAACCNSGSQKEAMDCANKLHCDGQAGGGDVCCKPNDPEDITGRVCTEKCRWSTIGPDGKPALACGDIPPICVGCAPYPRPAPPGKTPPKPPTLCQQAREKCVDARPNANPATLCSACGGFFAGNHRIFPCLIEECELKEDIDSCAECCAHQDSNKKSDCEVLVCDQKPRKMKASTQDLSGW